MISLITSKRSSFNFLTPDSYVYVSDSLWSINPLNKMIFDTGFFQISDFKIYSATQSVLIDGKVSNQPKDQLNLLNKLIEMVSNLITIFYMISKPY